MSKAKERLKNILNSIEDIEFIINNPDIKITTAIENKLIKPAIRMNLVKIAEQFNKLKNDNEFEILQKFSNRDLIGYIFHFLIYLIVRLKINIDIRSTNFILIL